MIANLFLWMKFVGASVLSSTDTLLIFDAYRNVPIPYAEIFCPRSHQQWTTNAAGQLPVHRLYSCTDTLQIRADGYDPMTVTISQLRRWNYQIPLRPRIFHLRSVTIEQSPLIPSKLWKGRDWDIVPAATIQASIARTSAEALEETGVLFVQKSQFGGGSPILRGFEANRILLVLDGIRFNTAIFRSGHLQNIIMVAPYSLASIDVLFGPASLQYGSDALGGAIVLNTKDPILSLTARPQVHGSAMVGFLSSSSAGIAHLDLSIGHRSLGWLGSITLARFDHLRQGQNRNPFYGTWGLRQWYVQHRNRRDTIVTNPSPHWQYPSGYHQIDFLQKMLYDDQQHWRQRINFQLSTSGPIPRYDRLTTQTSSGYPRYAQWFYGPQRRLFLGSDSRLRLFHAALDSIDLSIAYQQFRESRHTRPFRDSILSHRRETVTAWSFRLQSYHHTSFLHWLTGLEFHHNTVHSQAIGLNIYTGQQHPIPTRYPDGGSAMSWLGAFIFAHGQLDSHLSYSVGIRWDRVKLFAQLQNPHFYQFPFRNISRQQTSINGSLSLSWQPTPEWNLIFSLASAFRAPNIDDLAKIFDSKPGTVIMPNPDLEPERTLSLDLGLRWKTPSMEISATTFFMRFHNAIIVRPAQWNGQDTILYDGIPSRVFSNVNSPNPGWIYGGRLQWIVEFSPLWELVLRYSDQRGWLQTAGGNQPLSHIPPAYGTIALQYHRHPLRVILSFRFNGWKPIEEYDLDGEDNAQYATPFGTPAWIISTIAFYWRGIPNLTLSGEIENVFDTFYRPFASGISAPGRSFNFTITAHW